MKFILAKRKIYLTSFSGMNLKDFNLGAALTGFHHLSLDDRIIYCDGRNYIPPGLTGLEVDEVYLFKEINKDRVTILTQYFVAFVQLAPDVIQIKYQRHIFTLTSLTNSTIVLKDGTIENIIRRVNYHEN